MLKISCLYPDICSRLDIDDLRAAELLRRVSLVKGVKHVAVSSGLRHDLLARQPLYLKQLLAHHVGGLMKLAPEHSVEHVLRAMRKPKAEIFSRFLEFFREESRRIGKRQAVIPYLMSGHPGTTLDDMIDLARFLRMQRLQVEQVQEYTPTPGTLSTCIYHSGIDPFTGEHPYVARSEREKRLQKALLLLHRPLEKKRVIDALRACGRSDIALELLMEKGRRAPEPRTDKVGTVPGKRSSSNPCRKKS